VEPVADRGGDPGAIVRNRREAVRELGELLVGDQVAAGEDQVGLALEIGVDRADRETGRADDVLHRRPMKSALAEHGEGGPDDPVADFLFVLGGDAWHGGSWRTLAPLAY